MQWKILDFPTRFSSFQLAKSLEISIKNKTVEIVVLICNEINLVDNKQHSADFTTYRFHFVGRRHKYYYRGTNSKNIGEIIVNGIDSYGKKLIDMADPDEYSKSYEYGNMICLYSNDYVSKGEIIDKWLVEITEPNRICPQVIFCLFSSVEKFDAFERDLVKAL
jgi:hypothetical protein